MKKTFKFFLMAAIVAAGFTACSDEVVKPGPDGTDPVVAEGESTAATFNFKFAGLNSKATASNMQTDPTGQDALVKVSNIRLLIFNSSNQLEINEYYDTGATDWSPTMSKTVKLKSGQKQIFVSANETSAIKTILDALTDLRANPTTPSFYADFIAALDYPLGGSGGVVGNAHTDSLVFVGGSTPDFNIDKVIGTQADRLFFLSNAIDASASKTLKGKIEDTDSRNPPIGSNKEDYNNFEITIQRAVAKGVVFYEDKAGILNTMDGLGVLKDGADLKYGIDNVNRSVYLFQQFSGGSVMSTFYDIPFWPNDGLRARFYPYFYKDYHISNTMAKGTFSAIPSPAVYFTENTKAANYNANTTYAAIEAVFTPADNKWIKSLTYSVGLDQTTLEFGTNATVGGTIYALTLTNPNLKIANGTFEDLYLFTHRDTAYKALFLVLNGHTTGWTAGWTPTAEQLKNIDVYTAGKCYYRLDIGEGSGENIDCVVTRNTEYDMMVTGFKTIGVNDRRKLDDDPWKPKPSDTYVTATIVVKPWSFKQGSGPV